MGLASNGVYEEHLSVKVESKDKEGQIIETLDLVLTEKDDQGKFGIEHMVFMEGDYEFKVNA